MVQVVTYTQLVDPDGAVVSKKDIQAPMVMRSSAIADGLEETTTK